MRLFYLFFFMFHLAFGQSSQTLEPVLEKLKTVKDYSASAEISADIPMIKILPSKAMIYFKQKDKFKVKSKGIVIIPKQGLTDLNQFLANKSNYITIDGNIESINGISSRLITVIPNGTEQEIILVKLWIDEKRGVFTKTQMTTRSNGTVTTNFTYGSMAKYGLPNKMIFKIDVKKFKIPKSMSSDLHKTKNKKSGDKRKNGTITIKLSNYKVNSGLSDTLFN